MKKLLLSLVILLSVNIANAQLKVKTTKLDNGLKVVMCEDHSSPQVYGAVYVHAGSKNDPADATGMAHYFEHIMFKGTDKIGTINWEAEKVYLDSIDIMYDKLHETTDVNERAAIQKKINELSLASTDYAIPNEVDVILTKMGGTGLNAGTAYDQTMYFNAFPSNQIAKWMDVYVERFRYPVFRLFQSELETVYEEKNMYGDGPINALQEYMFKEIFGEHPYGRPIIGLTEHLKNPQTSKMREFFNTYYVANNMTLILVGDINIDEIEPMVAEKFGVWHSGEIPAQPEYTLPVFNGPTVKDVKMSPVKMGVLAWRGVSNSDQDYLPLSIASSIFSNGETGLMDKDMLDGNIMMAMLMPLSLEDNGANIVMYVPNLLVQSFEDAESYIFANLEKLKKGEFSDDLFEAIRINMLKEREQESEDLENLAELFLELESRNMTYDEYLAETERIKHITKDEVVAIANKYYNDNYLDIRSKMGSAPKDKVDKPNWKPIEAKNTDAKSEFAKMIEAEEVPSVTPQVIDFEKDVVINKINDRFTMISSKNPYNDIFTLCVTHNFGTINNPDINRAVTYWEMQGTQDKSFEEFSLELQKLGATIYIYCNQSNTNIVIEGFEKDLDRILALCEEKLNTPANDEKKKDIIAQNDQMEKETMKEDASTWGQAVRQYALYGEKSSYLTETPIKEWKKRTGEQLLNEVKDAVNYSGEVLFVGNLNPKDVIAALEKHNLVRNDVVKAEKQYRVENNFTENQIFMAHSKKFRQSNIFMHVPSETLNENEKAVSLVFNKYFGTDMYSIVFQEIREFRSLGYTAYSYFGYDYLNRKPGFLFGFLGTQSDKTNEGIEVFHNLITDMPERMEKFNASKDALILSRASDYISFRDIPSNVNTWLEMGYKNDPRQATTEIIKKTEYKDVYEFYKKNVADRPVIIMMSGNKKKIDMKALGKFGNVKELKYKEIFK
jgi:Predicted Zn-dependent peptidases